MDQPTRYQPEIDGLRALAITPVVLFHAGVPGLRGGYVGVDVFFVLSGFLISRLLLAELGQTGTIDFAGFYARRIRRLLPALALVVTAVLLVGAFILSPALERPDLSRSAAATMAFVSNIYFWRMQANYFAQPTDWIVLLNMWTLSVEEQFYLVWPVLLALAASVGRWSGAGFGGCGADLVCAVRAIAGAVLASARSARRIGGCWELGLVLIAPVAGSSAALDLTVLRPLPHHGLVGPGDWLLAPRRPSGALRSAGSVPARFARGLAAAGALSLRCRALALAALPSFFVENPIRQRRPWPLFGVLPDLGRGRGDLAHGCLIGCGAGAAGRCRDPARSMARRHRGCRSDHPGQARLQFCRSIYRIGARGRVCRRRSRCAAPHFGLGRFASRTAEGDDDCGRRSRRLCGRDLVEERLSAACARVVTATEFSERMPRLQPRRRGGIAGAGASRARRHRSGVATFWISRRMGPARRVGGMAGRAAGHSIDGARSQYPRRADRADPDVSVAAAGMPGARLGRAVRRKPRSF